MSDEITVRASLVWAVACAPRGTKRIELEAAANAKVPTGLDHGWKVSRRRELDSGDSHPATCLEDPARQHWLLTC
jgi:hypothetical protein